MSISKLSIGPAKNPNQPLLFAAASVTAAEAGAAASTAEEIASTAAGAAASTAEETVSIASSTERRIDEKASVFITIFIGAALPLGCTTFVFVRGEKVGLTVKAVVDDGATTRARRIEGTQVLISDFILFSFFLCCRGGLGVEGKLENSKGKLRF
mmetsp:Transcript_7713/g.11245  ORF Transcript_7713/g.11245 Transcript_7713/m.11245 type:complete len:155 (-) Transcript_7713:14-478(-)